MKPMTPQNTLNTLSEHQAIHQAHQAIHQAISPEVLEQLAREEVAARKQIAAGLGYPPATNTAATQNAVPTLSTTTTLIKYKVQTDHHTFEVLATNWYTNNAGLQFQINGRTIAQFPKYVGFQEIS